MQVKDYSRCEACPESYCSCYVEHGYCITGVILYITSLLFQFFISYDPFSDLKMQVSVSFYVVFSTMVIMILFNAKKKLSNKPEEKKK